MLCERFFNQARHLLRALTAVSILAVSACDTPSGLPLRESFQPEAGRVDVTNSYEVGSGDKLRMTVFNETPLSGEFVIASDGSLALPLIGSVDAAGLTPRELEKRIAEHFRDGYLRDPRISIEVLNYRPFYIYGEVQKGGEYPYAVSMSVLTAVALAGGYTYRADTRRVVITRNGEKVGVPTSENLQILPGDIVEIPERFF